MTGFASDRTGLAGPCGPSEDPALAPELSGHFQKILNQVSDTPGLPDPEPFKEQLDTFIRHMLYSPTDLADIFTAVSFIHDRLTAGIISHHVSVFRTRDQRPLPGPFCWISMGSDARQEQVVRTDQDNALIYGDPPGSEKNLWNAYFADLARQVVTDLDRFGFALCKGDVMATNPQWRRSLTQWHQALDRWIGSAEPAEIRTLTILLDFRPIHGDFLMAQALWERVSGLFQENPVVNHYLTRDDVLFSSPKTVFGRIRTHRVQGGRACFNIKTAGLVHLINAMRILALNHGIFCPSTLARMAALKDQGVLDNDEYDQCLNAFYHLNRLKIASHLNRDRHPDLPVNCADLSRLNRTEKKELKTVLDAVIHLQKRIRRTYTMRWMNFFN
jgi:signal-transduction protein with cAMP-binding, CBS, and nucleotidyltransferase domain